jgi:hypothetical protein
MHRADAFGSQPVRDRPSAEAEARELVAGDRAVLAGSERGELPLPLDSCSPAVSGCTWVVLDIPVALIPTHARHRREDGEGRRAGGTPNVPFSADLVARL